jgi:hypothetical protein
MFDELEGYQDADVRIFDNRFKMDAGIYARFYFQPEINEAKSAEAHRPVYEEKEYIEIVAPGNGNNIIRRRASDIDRSRFKAQYRQFKEGASEQLIGTPISEVPWLNRSQVEELNYLHIRTVEALAAIVDSECAKQVGLYDLKRRAKEYLEKAESDSSRISQLEETNRVLQEQLKELLAAKKEAK